MGKNTKICVKNEKLEKNYKKTAFCTSVEKNGGKR